MQVDDALHVGQAQPEALHVVDVAGMHTVELFEYLLDVLLLDALTCVLDREAQAVLIVPGLDVDIERLFGLAILHSVVHQIGDGVLEVNLVDKEC